MTEHTPEKADTPEKSVKQDKNNDSSWRQKALIWLGAFFVGIPVGILVGLSNSPVVGIVLTAILTTVVSIAIIVPKNKRLFMKRVEVASIMGLCWGLTVGALGGAIERNNGFITRQRTECIIDRWMNTLYTKKNYDNCVSSSDSNGSDCKRITDSLELRHRLAFIIFESDFQSENDSLKIASKNTVKKHWSSPDFGLKNDRINELKEITLIRSLNTIAEMKNNAEGSSYPCIQFIMSKYSLETKSPSADRDSARIELDKYYSILLQYANQ